MSATRVAGGRLPALVFGFVLAVQLLLVARIGTDIPYQDQWDVEGLRLYPEWRDGTWHAADLFRPHNEHRILWTRLLDLGLFAANAQWDPLVQLVANAVVRAAGAALLAWMLARRMGGTGRWLVGAGVGLAYLPHVAWQNALWGFQSQVYFVILFSVAALVLLVDPQRSRARLGGGLAAGVAALFAMGAGAFVPVVLLGLSALRAAERRRLDGAAWREIWPALVLLATACLLQTGGAGPAALHATTAGEFFNALERALAWPHTAMPAAAFALNLPMLIAVSLRLAGRRRAAAGEDFALLIGGWAVVAAGAMAWKRGGGFEFDAGVTIRYVDFLLLLPVANTWCAIVLAREVGGSRRSFVRVVACAWGLFLFIGWVGVSAQIMRGFILPRMRDRDLPVRLAVAYQRSHDAEVFARYHGFYQPHPDLASVRRVLDDPRMRGALPPSFQPNLPMGSLSRAVRIILRR